MKAARFLLLVAVAAGTTVAFAAPAAAAGAPDALSARTERAYSGVAFVVQNETEKSRLEAQGFPQYTD